MLRNLASAGCMLAATIVMPGISAAADMHGDFAVRGIGLEPCSRYVETRSAQSGLTLAARSWLNGYLTAYNQLVLDTYDVTAGTPLEELEARVAGYCEKNPGHTVAFAAIAVASGLDAGRVRSKPGEASATPRVEAGLARRIQESLKAKGHYKGKVDGVDGPGTRSAIASFQRAQGLAVTQIPDAVTLARLFQ